MKYYKDENFGNMTGVLDEKAKRDTADFHGAFVYENGRLARTLIPGGYIADDTAHYFIADHQGNVRLVVNGMTGAVEQETHYYPYGMPFGESSAEALAARNGAALQPYKYGGKEEVTLSSLTFLDFHARPYDTALARFLTPDPLREENVGMSGYLYCLGNPLTFVDRDGKRSTAYLTGNTVVIQTDIYIYGKDASQGVARQIQDNIQNTWALNKATGECWKYTDKETGRTYDVNFETTVTFVPCACSNFRKARPDANFIEINNDIDRSYVKGCIGKWKAPVQSSNGETKRDSSPHEFGHILGLTDKYVDVDDGKGKNRFLTLYGWENNIMGADKNRVVEQKNINILLDCILNLIRNTDVSIIHFDFSEMNKHDKDKPD